MNSENKNESPCISCTRVADASKCEYKRCLDWQEWFVNRWDSVRNDVRRKTAQKCFVESDTISVGGYKYTHPNHIRRFLQNKPCDDCDYKDGPCEEPCTVLVLWETMKKKVTK